MRRWYQAVCAGLLGLGLWLCCSGPAHAEDYSMGRYFYYPYYYFPHSYWPQMSPAWPEPPGKPYMHPPAYMSYPPFREPHWRYEMWKPQPYYRGFHFWLDQF
jgi:hypothetical protein